MNKRICLGIGLFFAGIFCLAALADDSIRESKMEQTLTTVEDKNYSNPFGVLEFLHWNHPWNNHKYSSEADLKKVVALMKEAGIAWVRMDFLWAEIEPVPGEFKFDKYDRIVDILIKNKINILGLLDYSTDWASSCQKWNCPPANNKLFVNYALEAIGHYKDKIKYWEVWNEPDSSIYWSRQDGLKSYCALLKDVYIAAKKMYPKCKILNGGLANGLASVNHLYDNGAKDYFDILNIHLFESPLNPNAIKAAEAYPKLVYKAMSRNGDGDKKIWITEIGCPGVKKGLKVKNWWMGRNPNEAQQAQWLKSVFTKLIKDKNIDKVFWAFFRDCNKHWNDGIDYFGLVRWDFSRKPAFCVYKELSRKWKKSK
jgi:hypothetical protein